MTGRAFSPLPWEARGRRDGPSAPTARHYALLALLFAAFALYGSLAPLAFRSLPWDEAQRRWGEVLSQPVRVGSRSDWAANILLFFPIGFFAVAALAADRGRAADLWAVPAVAACIGFSALLEFLQLYCPTRDSSINDIAAESLGATLGVALWVVAGRALTRGARTAWSGSAGGGAAARLLVAYLVVLALVQVFPPNLTLSPVELYHKYKAGLVRPVPFALWAADPAGGARKALEGAAWFLPLGLVAARVPRWAGASGRAAWEVLGLGMAAAAGAEFVRLFVVVHSCDATDIVTNGLAALMGWLAGRSAARSSSARLAAAAWVAALAYLNWFPFDFHFDGTAAARWREVSWVPFADYLRSSYLETAEGAADKVIQFVVLGAFLAAPRARASGRAWAALAASGLLACLLEAGQLFLPTRFTSVTDALVETASAGIGLWLWGRLRQSAEARPVWPGAAGNRLKPLQGWTP